VKEIRSKYSKIHEGTDITNIGKWKFGWM